MKIKRIEEDKDAEENIVKNLRFFSDQKIEKRNK